VGRSSQTWWLAALALGAGFGPAWVGNFLCEKHRPATFTDPLRPLRGDYHMFCLWITGRLSVQLRDWGAAWSQSSRIASL